MSESVLLGVSGLLITLLIAVLGYVMSLDRRVTKSETIISIIMSNAARLLIAPTHIERDLLVKKYERGELTEEDRVVLIAEMQAVAREDEERVAGERWSAIMILADLTATGRPRRWWEIWKFRVI